MLQLIMYTEFAALNLKTVKSKAPPRKTFQKKAVAPPR